MTMAEGKLAPAGIVKSSKAMIVAQDLGSLGEHLTIVIDKPPSVTIASLAKRPPEVNIGRTPLAPVEVAGEIVTVCTYEADSRNSPDRTKTT